MTVKVIVTFSTNKLHYNGCILCRQSFNDLRACAVVKDILYIMSHVILASKSVIISLYLLSTVCFHCLVFYKSQTDSFTLRKHNHVPCNLSVTFCTQLSKVNEL